MNKNKLIKISEFAKLCNVSKQTLIHYHKVGVIEPDYIDSRGYRYYSVAQYNAFEVIDMLRELDTPLSEIRDYLQNKNEEDFIKLLDKKHLEVKSKIKRLKNSLKIIEARKDLTQYGLEIQESCHIWERYCDREWIIRGDFISGNEPDDYSRAVSVFVKNTHHINLPIHSIDGIVEKETLLGNGDCPLSYFYARIPKKCKGAIIKPEGDYVITIHKGSYDTVATTYDRLKEYIKEHHYEISGDAYEDVVWDSCSKDNEDEFLTQVSIQIDKQGYEY